MVKFYNFVNSTLITVYIDFLYKYNEQLVLKITRNISQHVELPDVSKQQRGGGGGKSSPPPLHRTPPLTCLAWDRDKYHATPLDLSDR